MRAAVLQHSMKTFGPGGLVEPGRSVRGRMPF